jgi:hypothetical protein
MGDPSRQGTIELLASQSKLVASVAFATDGLHAAWSSLGQLTYWDLRKKLGKRLPVARDEVPWLRFTPDHRRIYFGTHARATDGTPVDRGVIGYWDTDGGHPPRILERGHGHRSLALLPDGGIATADLDGLVRLWRPSRSLLGARDLEAGGRGPDALAEYDRRVEDDRDDARLLIERGRLRFEQGKAEEAMADYDRAARLVPGNPQIFLDTAGWWIAGPYPPDLTVPHGFQIDQAIDPSKPAPPSGTSPRRWRRAPTGRMANVELGKPGQCDDVAAYALAIFHCATERDLLFFFGIDDLAVVYMNGQPVGERREFSPFSWAFPIRARAGRNTILVKVVNQKSEHSVSLVIRSLADDPLLRLELHP